MTGQEVAEEIDRINRASLLAADIEPDDATMEILNNAGLQLINLGSRVALSIIEAEVTVMSITNFNKAPER